MDYHMQFIEFLSLPRKYGLSYASFKNSLPFSINMDYHMYFTKFLSLLPKCLLSYAIFGNFSLLQKHGISYAISGISIPFQKTWSIICNCWNFFPFSRNVDIHMQSSRIPLPSP